MRKGALEGTKKGGSGGEMGGHLNFLSQQQFVLPLRMSGVIRADKQRKGHSENCIQLYLGLLCVLLINSHP